MANGYRGPSNGQWAQRTIQWPMGTEDHPMASGHRGPSNGQWAQRTIQWPVGTKDHLMASGHRGPSNGQCAQRTIQWPVGTEVHLMASGHRRPSNGHQSLRHVPFLCPIPHPNHLLVSFDYVCHLHSCQCCSLHHPNFSLEETIARPGLQCD